MKNRVSTIFMFGMICIVTSATIFGGTSPQTNQADRIRLTAGRHASAGHPGDGISLYGKYCSRCHGETGKAIVDFCSPDWQRAHSDAKIAATIRNGKQGTSMPSFKGFLDPKQVSALVRRIRSFGKRK